jgi:hypothetical protein
LTELKHIWTMRRVIVWRPTLKAIWDRWRGKRHPMLPLETTRVSAWKVTYSWAIFNTDWLTRVESELTDGEKPLTGGGTEKWD